VYAFAAFAAFAAFDVILYIYWIYLLFGQQIGISLLINFKIFINFLITKIKLEHIYIAS
jgi:hypothetical protein